MRPIYKDFSNFCRMRGGVDESKPCLYEVVAEIPNKEFLLMTMAKYRKMKKNLPEDAEVEFTSPDNFLYDMSKAVESLCNDKEHRVIINGSKKHVLLFWTETDGTGIPREEADGILRDILTDLTARDRCMRFGVGSKDKARRGMECNVKCGLALVDFSKKGVVRMPKFIHCGFGDLYRHVEAYQELFLQDKRKGLDYVVTPLKIFESICTRNEDGSRNPTEEEEQTLVTLVSDILFRGGIFTRYDFTDLGLLVKCIERDNSFCYRGGKNDGWHWNVRNHALQGLVALMEETDRIIQDDRIFEYGRLPYQSGVLYGIHEAIMTRCQDTGRANPALEGKRLASLENDGEGDASKVPPQIKSLVESGRAGYCKPFTDEALETIRKKAIGLSELLESDEKDFFVGHDGQGGIVGKVIGRIKTLRDRNRMAGLAFFPEEKWGWSDKALFFWGIAHAEKVFRKAAFDITRNAMFEKAARGE